MKTVLTIYAGVLGQPGLLLRLGGLMTVVLVFYQTALTLLLDSLQVPGDASGTQRAFFENSPRLTIGFIVYGAVAAWLTTIFAIRWHRYVLLGHKSYSVFEFRFGAREWRFVWNSIAMALIIGFIVVAVLTAARISLSILAPVVAPIFPIITFVVWILLLLLVNFFMGRFCLVFPAIALGVPMRIRDSWHKTWDEGPRVMLLLTAMALPGLVAPELVFYLVEPSLLPPWLSTAFDTFMQVFFLLITTALYASVFSHVYRSLGEPLTPPQYPTAPDPV